MRTPSLGKLFGWSFMRWALASVFLYAGIIKLQAPASLAASIARFRLVPEFVIHPMALGLPVLEVLCGVALLIGPWRRQAALGMLLLCLLFLGALSFAAVRGITVECTCFGAAVAEPLWVLIVRDLLFLVSASAIYVHLLRWQRHPAAEERGEASVLNTAHRCIHEAASVSAIHATTGGGHLDLLTPRR